MPPQKYFIPSAASELTAGFGCEPGALFSVAVFVDSGNATSFGITRIYTDHGLSLTSRPAVGPACCCQEAFS